ncbi:MAG TPA: phosphate ABC transporter substrate-binding protein PstS [Acidimicrobiales bacterium]|nr:phosphate ABC transporter substrate-binding protein PstS [Acidimicrobiales bacterium]
MEHVVVAAQNGGRVLAPFGRPLRARWVRAALVLGATGALLAACSSTSPTAAERTDGHSTTTAASSAPGGVLATATDAQSPAAQLTGAGANSIDAFFTRVFYAYSAANHGVSVNYSPAGSSVGITDIEQGTVQFGDSEVPIAAPAQGTGGSILQVPVDLGGVALSYNLPGVGQGLKLDGPTLAGIYLGSITTWNNPAIVALNPGVNLPHTSIVAVHRADSSGPGYDLDQYLIDTGGAAWTAKSGSTPSLHWPVTSVGVGQQLNTGVASYIQQTPGAIGYVEFAAARQAGFTNVALKNQANDFVAPSPTSIASAGAQAHNLSAANFVIVDGPGAGTYPLANFSWTLLYQKQSNQTVGIVLGKLFDWVTTTGQQQASALGYSPLPANVVSLAHQTLLQLQTSAGQPLFS